MCKEKQQMSASALLRYMQSCYEDAICSITLIPNHAVGCVDKFELHWVVGEKTQVVVLSEGSLCRDDKELQRTFNSVRKSLRDIQKNY